VSNIADMQAGRDLLY